MDFNENLPKKFEFYLKKFKEEKCFAAIKAGGNCLNYEIIESFKKLHSFGLNPILIHGGGNQIDFEMERRGIEIKKLNGKRITDNKTMKVVKESLNKINKDLVSKLNEGKIRAKGFSGIFYIKGPCPIYGYVGEAEKFEKEKIQNCLKEGHIPIISSLGRDEKGQFYNINADSAFRSIVEKFDPSKIIFLTPAGGVFKKDELISEINFLELEKILKSYFVKEGMKVKLEEVREIIKKGKNVQITSPKFLLEELFSEKGHGTYIQTC